MQLHTLQKNTSHKKPKRVGRGKTRGKTSGRGTKGQKARAGHSIRPAMRDTIKQLPKRRGFGKNRGRTVNADRIRPRAVSLASLESHFSAGDAVNPAVLVAKSLVRRQNGRTPTVKIIGGGSLTKALTFSKCEISIAVREKIEKAGGNVL